MDRSEENMDENIEAEKCGKRKSNRCYDIEKLDGMRDAIIKFENKKLPLRHCLLIIGKMSAGITVNGEIWEKHGSIQRDQKVNKNGIPFDKLSHLENIFFDRQIYSQITENELGVIGEELSFLNKKLIRVLQLEQCNEDKLNASEDINDSSKGSLSGIIDLSDKYFEMLTAKLIIREIKKWKAIDFSLKDDRYFIARLLSKTGEILNEKVKEVRIEGKIHDAKIKEKRKDRKDFVLKAFMNLIKIRNLLVHNFSVVADGIQDQNEIISKTIAAVREHMMHVFIHEIDVGREFTIDYQYEHGEKFEEDSEKLFNYLKGKGMSYESHKNELNRLILNAYELLAEDKEDNKAAGVTKNKIKNKLKSINKQYQSHLIQLNDRYKVDYPKVLCIERKDEIQKIGGELKSCHLKEKKELNNKDSYELLTTEMDYYKDIHGLKYERTLQYVHVSLMNDYWIMVANGYKDACNKFFKGNCETSKSRIEKMKNEQMDFLNIINEELNGLVQKSQMTYEQLDKEFKLKYPDLHFYWKKDKTYLHYNDFTQNIDGLCMETLELLRDISLSNTDHEEFESEVENKENKKQKYNEETIVEIKELKETCTTESGERFWEQNIHQQPFEEPNEKLACSKGKLKKNQLTIAADDSSQINILCKRNYPSSAEIKSLNCNVVIEGFIKECVLLGNEYVNMELAQSKVLDKFDYIMQQVVVHVLQLIVDWDKYFKNLENMKESLPEPSEYQNVLSCFQKYVTSRYMIDEKQLCKRYRSTGLSHRMLTFDRTMFLTETKDDTLSFFDFLFCFRIVLMSRNLSTVGELFDVATALCKISSFKESLNFYEKALQRAESHPEEVEQHEWDEWYLKIIGQPRMICHIYRLIMVNNYVESHLYEDVYQQVKEMMDKIDTEELKKCDISEIKETFCEYYRWTGEYFRNIRQDLNQALEWYKRSESVCASNFTKFFMGVVYWMQREDEKLRKTIHSMQDYSYDNDVNAAFKILLESLALKRNYIDPTVSDFSGDVRIPNEYEAFIATHKKCLKKHMRDNYCRTDFSMILHKLIVVVCQNNKQGMCEDRLKELVEIDKRFHDAKDYFGHESMSGFVVNTIYLMLCIGYCQIYIYEYSDWDQNDEFLGKAKSYFINCLKENDLTVFIKETLLQSITGWSLEYVRQIKDDTVLFAEFANHITCAQINHCKRHSKIIDATFLIGLVLDIEEKNLDFCVKLFNKIFNYFLKVIEEDRIVVNYIDLDIALAYRIKLQAIVDCDLQQFKRWFCIYHELSGLSLSTKQKQTICNQANNVKEIIINIGKVLIAIFYQRTDSIEPSNFSIKFCKQKLNIDCSYKNETFLWKRERVSSEDENQSVMERSQFTMSIERELSHIGELFVIIIFVMSYYKMDTKETVKSFL